MLNMTVKVGSVVTRPIMPAFRMGRRAATAEKKIIHSTHDKFFINLHALHNAWRLREILPRNLTEPIPHVTNREEFHHKMARKLQRKNPQKRAKAKEKAKETREQKKRAIELVEVSEGESEVCLVG
jgi:hypothetical protein